MRLDQFLAVIRAFEAEGVEYVPVGGVAVNMHGIVRTTEGIDVFVRPTETNVERIRAALRSLWDDPHIAEISATDLAGAYPTVRDGPPTADIIIDLLAGLGTAWRFDDLDSVAVDFGSVRVRVATPATLVRMKAKPAAPGRRGSRRARAEPSKRAWHRSGHFPRRSRRRSGSAACAGTRPSKRRTRIADA